MIHCEYRVQSLTKGKVRRKLTSCSKRYVCVNYSCNMVEWWMFLMQLQELQDLHKKAIEQFTRQVSVTRKPATMLHCCGIVPHQACNNVALLSLLWDWYSITAYRDSR